MSELLVEVENAEENYHSPFDLADFYKTGHPGMYPKETSELVANMTPRSAKYAASVVLPELYDNKVVWFGLQGFLQEWLITTFNKDFFNRPKSQAVRKYKRRMDNSLGNELVPVGGLEELHDLGYLPLEVKSLPEGSRVNIKVPPVLFLSTHKDFPWVATYFETLMSCESWKPSTVATIAFEFRKLLTYFAVATGAPLDFVDWQGHDFSFRGMSGVADAKRCGAGHLLSFHGTDTIPAIDYLEDYYGADTDKELVGGSIRASEHSVMALRILLTLKHLAQLPENEGLSHIQLRRMAEMEVVREFVGVDYATGMISMVSDTFDFWNVITVIAKELKDVIMNRGPDELGRAKVVFRPDSGNPVRILAGYRDDEVTKFKHDGYYQVIATGNIISDYERKGAVECLWDIFGGTTTENGYKLLDSHVGMIYGDSITMGRALEILQRLQDRGFASCNVVFGIGSFTYNFLTRDIFGWAMKAIYAKVGDEDVDIYKDPATDDGTKKSACGLPRVEKEGDDYVLYDKQSKEESQGGELVTVFRNSKMIGFETYSVMRERLLSSWTCPPPGSIKWNDRVVE